jgi:hypothetical protein
MNTAAITYINYTKFLTQRYSNLPGVAHAALDPDRLATLAKRLQDPPPGSKAVPAAPATRRQKMLGDMLQGASYGAGMVAKVDCVAGRGAANVLNTGLTWADLVDLTPAAQVRRAKAVKREAKVASQDWTHRGIAGEVVDLVFLTGATPAYLAGSTVGSIVGAVVYCGAVLCLGRAAAPTLSDSVTHGGAALGCALGTVFGLAAALGPWGTLLLLRLGTAGSKALFALAGAGLFGLVSLRHLLPAEDAPAPVPHKMAAAC